MHAHRCKECTLYRCDVAGAVCSECSSSLQNHVDKALEAINKTYAAGITLIYSSATLSGGTSQQQAPGGKAPAILTLIPGDSKHNAEQAARALMMVEWGSFHTYCLSIGALRSQSSLNDLYVLLQAFASS